MFDVIKNNNIMNIDGKIDLYDRCNGCGFKKFAIIDKEKLNDLLKDLI